MQNPSVNQTYLPQNNSYQPNPVAYSQQSLQPYNSQEFLFQTFNYNTDYINSFNTLTHQQKLKMYLSVQEMKMMGKMNDKQGYQKILKQIVRRVTIMKPNLNKKSFQPKKQKQQVDWGSKLQDLCQSHLKKMQNQDLLDDIPIDFKQSFPQVNQNDLMSGQVKAEQQEWQYVDEANTLENTQQKKLQFKQQIIQKNLTQKQKIQNDQEGDWQWQQSKEDKMDIKFQQINSYSKQPNLTSQNNMDVLNTIAFQKPQQIDIWQLNVQEQQRNKKKTIAKILHSQTVDVSLQNKNSSECSQKIEDKLFNEFLQQSNKNYFPSDNKNHLVNEQHGLSHEVNLNKKYSQPEVKQDDTEFTFPQEEMNVNTHQINSQPEIQYGNTGHTFPEEMNVDINNTISQPEISNQEMNQPIFGFGSQIHQSSNSIASFSDITTKKSISVTDADLDLIQANEKKKQETQQNHMMGQFFRKTTDVKNQLVNEFPVQQNIPNQQVQIIPNNSNFKFDNFDILQIPNEKQNNLKIQEMQFQNYDKQTGEFQEQNIQNQVKAQTFLSGLDTNILKPLLIQMDNNYLMQCLNKNVFDLDFKFYKKSQNLINSLGYKNSKDYQFVLEQEKTCEKIVQLTQMYTAAVQQDQEQVVKQAIAESKKKYKQLNTKRTARIVQKYIKMNGKGLIFRVGQLIMAAGVSKQLIQKTVESKNIIRNFSVLYGLQSLNTLNIISSFTHKIVQYFEAQYVIYKKKKSDLQSMNQTLRSKVQCKDQYKEYRNGLSKISNLCRRMLNITKVCTNQKFHSNGLKLGKQLKEVDIENHDDDPLIPDEYCQTLQDIAKKGQNVYTLYNQFISLTKKIPICIICLRKLQYPDEIQKSMHYSCHNIHTILSQIQ